MHENPSAHGKQLALKELNQVIFLAQLLLGFALSSASQDTIPEHLSGKPLSGSSAPIYWTSARARLSSGARDIPALARSEGRISAEKLATLSASNRGTDSVTPIGVSDCPVLVVDTARPRGTTPPDPEAAASSAKAIAVARAIAIDQGFLGDSPATMTSIRIERVLRGGDWLKENFAEDTMYLPSPGNFAIDGEIYCLGKPSLGAREGQRVLVLFKSPPYDASRRLLSEWGFFAYAIDERGLFTSQAGEEPADLVIESLAVRAGDGQ